jgi:DNA (cytosine-5)-methyltransferase 1
MITVGTDCSGIEAPLQALIQLKVQFKQLWACDIDKYTRLTCEANYPKPEKVYTDMLVRHNKELPHVDLYVCGFPCQTFSLAGRRLGLDDPRPSVISSMLDTVAKSKPKIVILENVTGFKSIDSGKPYALLIQELSKEYNVAASIYNTKDYGLPQNRKRIYFVCIRKDIQKKKFVKPSEVKMKSLESIINDKVVGEKIPLTVEQIGKLRFNKDAKYNIINTGFLSWNPSPICSNLIVPTILTSNQHFIYELKRPFTISELLQLQGFPKNFKVVVSNTQIIKQIGNSMSVCVLKKIIKEALLCI